MTRRSVRQPALVMLGFLISSAQAQPNPGKASLPPEKPVEKASEVASITTDRGIVTRPGKLTIEPAISYANSNSTVVAVEGYTVIPALLVGLINITEVQRDIFVGALTFKYGITSRLETTLRAPYLSIREDLRERQAFQGTPVDSITESSGDGLGDIEATLRYQFNDGVEGWPYVIGSFRIRAPTGEGPYDVDRRILRDNLGNPIGIAFTERPTGSGFWGFEPGLSFIYPSDPAVLFGNLSYTYTLEEDEGFANGGTVDPGDIIRFGFGMGFAFNERTSFSLSYDHSIIPKTELEFDNNLDDARFDRIQLGSLAFGLSQRLTADTSVSLSVSVGVTENAPSTELTLKLPMAF
ncbi:transporter [Marinobacter sp. BGYM27]|uniref:transporter n=1 Tax=Marinobacter sp. BGYM27 TaxID=2975597 RepID=UPI0021A89636|nr:transporter [Marinobacter sp. BGYM27]MDG5500926.1 transporter [Marinobacter sp. BGYM27]